MTQEEIQERNKEIVLMLGWKKTSAHKVDQYGWYEPVVGYSTPYRNTLDTQAVEYQFDKNAFATGDLQFHLDWNWLMMAVEFIESRGNEIDIFANCVEICTTPDEDYVSEAVGKTKKEAVFIAVSDFAKLYNEGVIIQPKQ
jgi:hypothetical protein